MLPSQPGFLKALQPAGHGALRPLGLPATEDTRLQTAVTRIRDARYAHACLASSDGDRQKSGAREAVRDRTRPLPCGPYGYGVDADIQGDCAPRDHLRLMDMLRERRDDRPFLGLIRPSLKAGVRDTDGQGLHPVTGLPQGGSVSPVLAHLSLHHALERWLPEVVPPPCAGVGSVGARCRRLRLHLRPQRDAGALLSGVGQTVRAGRPGARPGANAPPALQSLPDRRQEPL